MTLDAATISTGDHRRDARLRSSAFLHVDTCPFVRFTSVTVGDTDGRLHVRGWLEVPGRRTNLTFNADLLRSADAIEIEATALVDEHALGIASSRVGTVSPVTLSFRVALDEV